MKAVRVHAFGLDTPMRVDEVPAPGPAPGTLLVRAAGASYFGLRVVWVNRFAQAREKLPQNLDAEIKNLGELADQLGV